METHTHPRKWSARLGIGGLALLACIAVALCGLIGSPRAAHAAVGDYGTLEDGTYTVTARLSAWMNWDVTDGSTSNEAKVQSYHHNGTGAQVWKITTDSDGYSTIINVNSGKALDVPDGKVASEKQLQQYTPNGTKAQKWKIIERSDGCFKIVSALDESYVIDQANGWINDGNAVQLFTSNDTYAQRWHIDKVADQTTTVLPDQTKLFDTSVYITDAQAGTYTWEKVPDGWKVETSNDWAEQSGEAAQNVKVQKLKWTGDSFPFERGEVVLRIDRCGKVDGRWITMRLTFSNIVGYNEWDEVNTQIALKGSNVWRGVATSGVAQMDMKLELLDTETGGEISLKDAYFSGVSLNNHDVQDEGIRYLAGETFASYLLKGHGLKVCEDGTWRGSSALDGLNWEDFVGGNNLIYSGVGIHIVDDAPVFRLYLNVKDVGYNKLIMNLSPLTIAAPLSPTKSATITG